MKGTECVERTQQGQLNLDVYAQMLIVSTHLVCGHNAVCAQNVLTMAPTGRAEQYLFCAHFVATSAVLEPI